MTTALYSRLGLANKNDLTTPTSTQNYPLGYIYIEEDKDKTAIKRYMYVKAHTGLTQYAPYVITNGATAGAEVITAAPAALNNANVIVCFPQVAFTSGYYGFVQIEGNLTSVITASTGAIATYALTLTAAAATLVTTTGTARTVGASPTVAYLVTTTTGTTCSAYAPGLPVIMTT